MTFTGKDPVKTRPYESYSPRVPTQADIDTIVGAIEMLKEQNAVLSQIVDNILQDCYQEISQTSLTDGLSQALFTSMVEQARLCKLLVDHRNRNQLNTSDSLLPMDLTKEEGKSRSHKRAFPEMDLSEWGITYREFCPRKANKVMTGARSHINKLPSLKNFRPTFATIVDNPGITPINSRTLGETSPIHRGKAPKQIRVVITRSQIFK
jgi:hypothetical protein